MSKIEWCDITWNPVWGCKNMCEYCYARKMAKRFYKKIEPENKSDQFRRNLLNFYPTWIESNFRKDFSKSPKRIFVNSMSDIAYWEFNNWMPKVIEKIKKYPQHKFLFLTQQPIFYGNYDFPENCWLGVTATNQSSLYFKAGYMRDNKNLKFISIEPIKEKIKIKAFDLKHIDWIIIGAETGNRKNKIIPEKSWIEEFRSLDIPVFMKDNLRPIIGDNLRQEFPI